MDIEKESGSEMPLNEDFLKILPMVKTNGTQRICTHDNIKTKEDQLGFYWYCQDCKLRVYKNILKDIQS